MRQSHVSQLKIANAVLFGNVAGSLSQLTTCGLALAKPQPADRFYTSGVRPGAAAGAVSIFMSQVSFSGMVSSLVLSACSQLTVLPVYAAMRPMIAVRVLSATFFSSLSVWFL